METRVFDRIYTLSLGIAVRYGLDGPGIETRWRRYIPQPSSPALGYIQSPVQLGTGYLFGDKPATAWSSPHTPSSAEVNETVKLYLKSPSGLSWPVLG